MNVIVFQHDLYRHVGLFKRRVDLYKRFYKGIDELNFMGFDGKRAKSFIAREYGDQWVRVYENCIPWAMKSDIFRVLATYSLGGLYIDSKFAVKGIPRFVKDEPEKLHICEWHDGHILNGVFYSPKAHPLLSILMDRIFLNLKDPKRPNSVFATTGPAVWRKLLCDLNVGDSLYRVKPELSGQVSVFTKRAFFRSQGVHLDIPNTRGTSEHWSIFQKENSIFRDAPFDK